MMKKINKGYIKLHRQILDWEWWDDANTFKVFMYCLINANHTAKKWHGITINRGEFLTSNRKLSTHCRLSLQSIRTILKHLKSTHELTYRATHQYTIISVLKYEEYQSEPTHETTHNLTNDQHTPNTRLTSTKNVLKNALKNEKETHAQKSTDDSHGDIDFYSNEYKKDFYNIKPPQYCHRNVWKKWIDYRWQIKKPYMTMNGAQSDMNDLEKIVKQSGKNFMDVVNYTINKEWKRFYPITKSKDNDNDNNSNESIVPDDISRY